MKIGHGTRPQAPPPETGGRRRRLRDIAQRVTAYVMTGVLSVSTLLGSISPIASAYADDIALQSEAAPGDGWYYLVANGGDAINSYVLNLEKCASGTGVNAFVTNQHANNDRMLKMAENMWYIQHVDGDWFTIRNVHGYAISANEDGNDNLQTEGYTAASAAQKWHLDAGKLVAQNGDTMKLANGLTAGSPICDQNNRSSSDITWGFERVSVQGTISGYSKKQNVGTKITQDSIGFNPGAHIGYTDTDDPTMDANRAAGVRVSFSVRNGDGAERALPYTIAESDRGKTITLIARVKSAFGQEMWTTEYEMTVNESHEEGSEGGEQGGSVGVDPGGVGEDGGSINTPGSIEDSVTTDGFVGRWDSEAMHERNRIVLNGDATLTDADIKLLNFNTEIIEDTAINTDETGHNKEYVISVADVEQDKSNVGIEATYRNIGIDPITGRSISVLMRMTNFIMSDPGYCNLMNTAWGLPDTNENIKYPEEVPPWEDPNAIFYPTPNIRLAANFDGGYWMMGVEKVTIDYYFYYDNDPTQEVDLTNAFLTVQSLDHDSNGLGWNGEMYGQEAVSAGSAKYDHILLTPNSAVGRWGDLTGFSSRPYQGGWTDDPGAFYNPDITGMDKVPSDLAVTLFGVHDGSNHFVFDMIDTGANTHNMPYFGTIGTVYPPDPEKFVKDRETGEWVDYDEDYILDDTAQFKVEQYIPGRDEQLGNYQSVSFTDTISDDLEVVGFHVYREDGGEVTSGTTQLGNNLKYDFDLGAEDVYGHTYSFIIDVKVVDYPEGDSLIIPNAAQTHFGASNGTLDLQTNTVKIELINPELRVWKEIVIDDDASVINDYEYLIGDVITYDAYVINENAGTRAKDVTFYDHMPEGLDYIEGSITVTDDNGNTVTTADDGNGWKLTFTNFDYNKPVKVRYQAYATEAGNGKEVINCAYAWAVNVPKDVDGNETQQAWNESEAYINDPNLKLLKSVTQSEIQNPDYQQGEEYRVDDTFRYTVTVVNTEPGTFAENVIITDDDLPEGFELVGGPTITGLDENGFPKTIEFPKHFEDDKHGQHETHEVKWSTKSIKHDDTGSWGWEVDVNFLAYGMTCSITWEVRATDEMNGYEVYNRAWAKAENQPNDTFWSTDDSSDPTRGNDYTVVWINTPEFDIEKTVRKTDQTYQVGDVAAYDIVVSDLKDPGTLARQTTLDDEFQQEGTTIIEDSFVITDKPTEDEPQDISEQVELNRYVGKQGYHIDMTQVYGDDSGYWVNSEDWRPIYRDGAAGRVEGEHNPVQAKPEYDKEPCESDSVDYAHDYFKVHYEATINEMALQNKMIDNIAVVDSLEGFPADDNAQVTVIGAQLDINKDSNDGGGFTVGDVAEYELTIVNNATGTVAENVQIKDGFTTAKPGTVSIVEGSIEVFDNQGKELLIAPSQITYVRNESGNIFGFTIDTGYDLPSSQKLTVRYDVKYLANNGGQVIKNVAYTWADNAPEVQDDYETWPDDMNQSDLRIDKGSDSQTYDGDSFGTYTLNIVNHSEDTALNVVINDDITLDSLGIAQIVKGTIKLYDHHANAISWDRLEYHYANGGQIKGFTIYTDYDLDPQESIQVVYQVYFDEVAQDTQVHNDCWTASDNTGKATDDNDVTITPDGNPGGGDPDDPGDIPSPETPSLAIVKTSNKQWFTPGETGRYELRVTNRGENSTAENVVIEDGLDAEARELAQIVEGSIVATDAMGDAIPVQSVKYQKDDMGRVYGFTIDTGYDLAYGGAIDVSYDVEVDGEVKDTEKVTNLASADSDNTPPAETDHNVNLDPEGMPELILDKSADKQVVAPGDTLTYTVVVEQPTEGQVAEDTVITDTLPDGFTLDQDSVKVEMNGHAKTADVEYPAGKIRVSLGDVAYGETWEITYSGTVDKDFLGDELHNVVVGESTNIPEDPTDETTTPVTNPKLTIEKTADATEVEAGDELTWEITVTQVNKDTVANNVIVTDELPDGFEAEQADVTVTDAQGHDRKANVEIVNGKLTVELGDMAYNDPAIISVPGIVEDNFDGDELHNVAVVDADNIPNPVDDDETVPVIVVPELDLVKEASTDTIGAGGTVDYTLTTTVGNEDAENVIITDELPDGLTAVDGSVHVYLNDELVQFEDTKKASDDSKDETESEDKADKADSDEKAERKKSETTDEEKSSRASITNKDEDDKTSDTTEDEADTTTSEDEDKTADEKDEASKVTVKDDNGNAPQFDDRGILTVEMGDLKAHDVVRIEYSAKADADVQPGDKLVNTAVASADGIDPVRDEATVTVPSDKPGVQNTPTTDRGDGVDLSKDLGSQLKNTGDALAGAYIPAIAGAVALISLMCLAMYNRERVLEVLSGIKGPIGEIASRILARLMAAAGNGKA